LSKIYEALKKAEQEREQQHRGRSVAPPLGLGDGTEVTNVTQEEYQKLRASLVSIGVPSGLHSILVTAPRHREGATTVAVGLAGALAKERDARVLLLEGNLRTPAFTAIFPIRGETGLVDFAAGRATPEALVTRLEEVNLSVLCAGTSRGQPIDFEVIDALLGRLQSQFDFIVIDGAPVNDYADSSVLATKVDGVILVIEADKTPVPEAETAKRQLSKVGARILGVVLNRRRSYIPAFLESIL
jgi:capsular exopolysaccharide synthesis family protein